MLGMLKILRNSMLLPQSSSEFLLIGACYNLLYLARKAYENQQLRAITVRKRSQYPSKNTTDTTPTGKTTTETPKNPSFDQVTDLCVAICTAHAFKTKELFEEFPAALHSALFREVVHIDFTKDGLQDAFFFPYGVAVFWGCKEEKIEYLRMLLKPFEITPLDVHEREVMNFSCSGRQAIVEEEILLPANDVQYRLAVSHALAQSVKLNSFETIIQKTIASAQQIPQQLALKGKILLSKKEIRKKMGELFIERSSINFHLDILDVPEYFWEHSEIEPLYRLVATHLELGPRLQVLNQRLDIVHDLFEMLGNELKHQHSSSLEWIIILLIVIEVLISIWREFLCLH